MTDVPPTELDAAQAELLGLLAAEFRDGGFETELVPADGGVPPQVVAPIGADHAGRFLRTHIYFVPGVDEPAALQYFVTLPYAIAEGTEADVARVVAALNTNLPLTGFEYSEASAALVFRHTHAVNVRPLDPGVVAWTLSMVGAAVSTFGALLERVADGLPVDAARDEMSEILSGLFTTP